MDVNTPALTQLRYICKISDYSVHVFVFTSRVCLSPEQTIISLFTFVGLILIERISSVRLYFLIKVKNDCQLKKANIAERLCFNWYCVFSLYLILKPFSLELHFLSR